MTQGWEAEVLNCPDIADNHDNYHYCDIGDNDDDNLHYYDTRRRRAILGHNFWFTSLSFAPSWEGTLGLWASSVHTLERAC